MFSITGFLNSLIHDNRSGSLEEIELILAQSIEIKPRITGSSPEDPGADPEPAATAAITVDPNGISWIRDKEKAKKTTVVPCIVIDRYNRWHPKAKLDLGDMNTSGFTWAYYGKNYPVFVEQDNGELSPFFLPETAGENSNRLYKAANPSGFKATFTHKTDLMAKLQVGLMVALVLGLFFLMFILLNWK